MWTETYQSKSCVSELSLQPNMFIWLSFDHWLTSEIVPDALETLMKKIDSVAQYTFLSSPDSLLHRSLEYLCNGWSSSSYLKLWGNSETEEKDRRGQPLLPWKLGAIPISFLIVHFRDSFMGEKVKSEIFKPG